MNESKGSRTTRMRAVGPPQPVDAPSLSAPAGVTSAKDADDAACLRAILETAVETIVTIDEHGLVESINEAGQRMFGFAAAEVVGHNVSMLMPSPHREQHDQYIARYLATGEGRIIGIGREVMAQRKDGTSFPVFLSVSEVRLRDRRIFTGLMQDVTDLKRAQHQLVQAERLAAIGEAMTALTHESRNALQRGQACLELLGDHVLGDAEAERLVGRIQTALDDLQRHYEEVREFAAPLRLDRSPCDLGQVVQESWTHLLALHGQRPVQWELRLVALSPKASIDPFALRQVFRNILENSLAACSDPVAITVSIQDTIWETQPALQIVLRDNGPGLNSEQATRAFDPFYTTKVKGTGLGLAIAKRIVEAHGGTISLNSGYRDGAEFVIVLPSLLDGRHEGGNHIE